MGNVPHHYFDSLICEFPLPPPRSFPTFEVRSILPGRNFDCVPLRNFEPSTVDEYAGQMGSTHCLCPYISGGTLPMVCFFFNPNLIRQTWRGGVHLTLRNETRLCCWRCDCPLMRSVDVFKFWGVIFFPKKDGWSFLRLCVSHRHGHRPGLVFVLYSVPIPCPLPLPRVPETCRRLREQIEKASEI